MESKTYLFLTEERQSDKEPNASLSGGQSNKVSAKTERAILQRAKCFIFSFKTEQRRAKYPTFFFFKDRTKTVNKKSVSSPKADKQQRAERPTFSLKPDRAIFSSVPRPIGSQGRHRGRFSRDPLPVFPAGGPCVAQAGLSTLWCYPCSISSADHRVAHPPRCPEGYLERLSWHVTCPNHANFGLLTVPRRGSCRPTRKLVFFTPSRWSCAPSRRRGEVSSGTWFLKSRSFFSVNKQGPRFTTIEKDGGNSRLVQLEHACEADGAAPPDFV